MKKILFIGLLIYSNLTYSQSFQIIDNNDFAINDNQAFVLFKIRVNDFTGFYTSEQVESGTFVPLLNIVKFDNIMTKKWDTPINSAYYIQQRIKGGTWEKKNKLTVYEWTYFMEAKPDKDGYYFEYILLKNSSDKPIKIPIFRFINPTNNTLLNYGTIEITISDPDRKLYITLTNSDFETTNLTNHIQLLYPRIYDAYKEKVLLGKLNFFFVDRQEKVTADFSMKTFYHFWENPDAKMVNILHDRMVFNSKNGEKPYAFITFNEIDLPQNFDITYKSDWGKGENNRPFGLILANSDENKYFFHTSTIGKSMIEGTCNGSNEPLNISYDLEKISKKNDYRIEVREKKVTYYINSTKIGAFELNYSLSDSCKVGFMVYDKQKVTFSDFQIIEK